MKKSQESSPVQLTRDDAARIIATAVNAVLNELDLEQVVDGIMVSPLGEGVWHVDVVMQNLTEKRTWAVSLTIPPPEGVTDARTD